MRRLTVLSLPLQLVPPALTMLPYVLNCDVTRWYERNIAVSQPNNSFTQVQFRIKLVRLLKMIKIALFSNTHQLIMISASEIGRVKKPRLVSSQISIDVYRHPWSQYQLEASENYNFRQIKIQKFHFFMKINFQFF